jgi:hypothetical protein
MKNEKTFTITLTASEFSTIQDVLYYTLEHELEHFTETVKDDGENKGIDFPEFNDYEEEMDFYINNTTTGHIYRDAYNADKAMHRNMDAYLEAVKTK